MFRYLVLSVIIFISTSLISQSSGPEPISVKDDLSNQTPVILVENQQVELSQHSKFEPLQAGYTIPINILFKEGILNTTKSGYVWRISILVENAKAINIYSESLSLSDHELVFIYSSKNSGIEIFDSSDSKIVSDFFSGNIITVEYNSTQPITELPFILKEIGILVTDGRGYGDAGSCEVKVNCIEGENWQDEKNGIARILVKEGNSTFWCTGSLINNTLNDRKPYFLTANHCGVNSDSTDYTEWMFYFNYEAPGCGDPSTEPDYNLITGSQLLAHSNYSTSSGSDFKLLLLTEQVSPSIMPYYNGWDKRAISSNTGVSIHHPQGDIKMISTYTTPLISTKYDSNTEDPNGLYWKVIWAETQNGHGVTEGGSSGSPIFSNDGLILGALTGGRASCSFEDQSDFYGKFSFSWDGDMTDSTTNLSYWLDPIGSGVGFLKGTNFDSTNVYAGFSAEKTSIVIGESISFINTSFGNITSYKWEFEGGDPGYSEKEEPDNIKYSSAGEYDVKLIVSSADGSDTLLIDDYIKVLPNISPNPANGIFNIGFGGDIPEDVKIWVFDSFGNDKGYKVIEQNNEIMTISILPASDGVYFIRIESSVINNTFKVVVTG